MTSISPSTFSKTINFKNANYSNNSRFNKSGKSEELFNRQDSVFQEHQAFMNANGRELRNSKHQASPKAEVGGV